MKKGKKSKFRKIVEWLHLWPSLVASIIVIFVCLTGTIIVFSDEIIDFANRDVLYVKEVKENRVPAETLIANFKAAFPNRRMPGYMIVYKDPKRSVKFNSYEKGKGLRFVYMDPYTGKVMKDDGTVHFFYVTAHLHNSMLLGKPGQWIIDIATIVFVIGLITGLVLWWPKKWTKKSVKDSFTVRWKARFKRVNYDLHNVLGFYTLALTFVLAITGLIIAFGPMADLTLKVFGGATGHEWEEGLPANDTTKSVASIEHVVQRYFKNDPSVKAVQLGTYFLDKRGYYMLSAVSWVGLKNHVGHTYLVDKHSGEELALDASVSRHFEVENVWWMLHMGTWMGLTSKILTFIAGIIATSLSITGFIIWWGKRKKKKPRKGKVATTTKRVEKHKQPANALQME